MCVDRLFSVSILKLVMLWRWYESWSLFVKMMVCLWMPFLSFRKAELRIFFKHFDTSILSLAIESRRGSRDDSSARMRPVIAMWYNIRMANHDEENLPDERWTVVVCDLSIEHHRDATSSFFQTSLQMMHRCVLQIDRWYSLKKLRFIRM